MKAKNASYKEIKMAGKLCYGSAYNNAGAGTLRSSKSFCEGINYRAGGTLLGRPKVDNPHLAGSDAALAWNLGWDFAEASSGGALDTRGTCCAAPAVVPA